MPTKTETRKPSAKRKAAPPATKAVALIAEPAAAALPLPPWDREVSDTVSLSHHAQTALERRRALDYALNGPWVAEDTGMVRRVESDGQCLWVMWKASSLPAA